MLTLQPGICIFIHTAPADMRKPMDELEKLVRHHLGEVGYCCR